MIFLPEVNLPANVQLYWPRHPRQAWSHDMNRMIYGHFFKSHVMKMNNWLIFSRKKWTAVISWVLAKCQHQVGYSEATVQFIRRFFVRHWLAILGFSRIMIQSWKFLLVSLNSLKSSFISNFILLDQKHSI